MQIANPIPQTRASKPGGHGRREMKAASALVRVLQWLGLLLLVGGARAQTAAPTEYQVKAAFLYNFAKFVEWPASSFPNEAAPLLICILGQDPFGEGLREITRDKTVNGRKIAVMAVADLARAKGCHVLFIATAGQPQLKQILESLRGASMLTVADTPGFIELGGMINFVLENARVQFEVNSKAAEQAGLRISSKLLNVAKSVTL